MVRRSRRAELRVRVCPNVPQEAQMIMRRKTFQPRLPRRRGATAVLAMLYLVLFSTMAVGFYAATTMSAQVSANDERITRSFAATESGMDFIRFHLARVNLPSDPNTPDPTYELWHDID